MSILSKLTKGLAAAALGAAAFATVPVNAAEVTIRVQSVISAKADEVVMLKNFADDVLALTADDPVRIEVLPAGAVVGVKETLDAVDKGLIEGGFAWTHYWSGKHPAAMLFGSPVAGAGVGIDNIAFVSWFQSTAAASRTLRPALEGNGRQRQRLHAAAGRPGGARLVQGADHLDGGFPQVPLPHTAGYPGQTYKDIGVASVAMGGGDILPALEKGTIDAAEWCCPKPDSVFGFQKVLKHYYLQGLHQVVVNADLYINGDVYDSMTDHQKKAIEVAANASLVKAMSYRIYENGKALKDLTENHGVILHDTPADYFPAYMNAAKASLEKNAAENEFFAKVWQSQKDFAALAVPFWAGAQASNAALGKAFADSVK